MCRPAGQGARRREVPGLIDRSPGEAPGPTEFQHSAGLHLDDVSFARDHGVEDGVDEEGEAEARDEPGNDHNRKRLLRVGADAGGERRG